MPSWKIKVLEVKKSFSFITEKTKRHTNLFFLFKKFSGRLPQMKFTLIRNCLEAEEQIEPLAGSTSWQVVHHKVTLQLPNTLFDLCKSHYYSHYLMNYEHSFTSLQISVPHFHFNSGVKTAWFKPICFLNQIELKILNLNSSFKPCT